MRRTTLKHRQYESILEDPKHDWNAMATRIRTDSGDELLQVKIQRDRPRQWAMYVLDEEAVIVAQTAWHGTERSAWRALDTQLQRRGYNEPTGDLSGSKSARRAFELRRDRRDVLRRLQTA